MNENWWSRARCRGEDPEMFFAFGTDFGGRTEESAAAVEAAKEVCRACPVRRECREWALDNENFGVWGGTTAYERRKIRERWAEKAAQGKPLGGTCPKGHERTADTVRVNRVGQEYCLICHRLRGFNTAAAVAAAAATRGRKTHCVNNHELAGDNVLVNAKGYRACRRCKADRMKRARISMRGAVAHAQH